MGSSYGEADYVSWCRTDCLNELMARVEAADVVEEASRVAINPPEEPMEEERDGEHDEDSDDSDDIDDKLEGEDRIEDEDNIEDEDSIEDDEDSSDS